MIIYIIICVLYYAILNMIIMILIQFHLSLYGVMMLFIVMFTNKTLFLSQVRAPGRIQFVHTNPGQRRGISYRRTRLTHAATILRTVAERNSTHGV